MRKTKALLTEYQRWKLEYWYCHMKDDIARWQAAGEHLDWNFYDSKATMQSLERKGIVERIRDDGGSSWVGTLTLEGELIAAELGAAKKVIEEAEKAVEENSPDKLLERRWEESLGLRHVHVFSHAPHGEQLSVTLHITFANEGVSEKFRLDLMGVMLKYRKRGKGEQR